MAARTPEEEAREIRVPPEKELEAIRTLLNIAPDADVVGGVRARLVQLQRLKQLVLTTLDPCVRMMAKDLRG